MTEIQMTELKPGEIVRHKDGNGYIVLENCGLKGVVVTRTLLMTNPSEWLKICRECNQPEPEMV